MNRQTTAIFTALALVIAFSPIASAQPPSRIAGTELLTLEGDIASHLVAGVDRFLLGELANLYIKGFSYNISLI